VLPSGKVEQCKRGTFLGKEETAGEKIGEKQENADELSD
jgi:hypothetical protein